MVWLDLANAIPERRLDPSGFVITCSPAARAASAMIRVVVFSRSFPVTSAQPWVAHHRMDARRELPWVPIRKEYRIDTEEGSRTLRQLFGGRSQLIVYHFMFGPTYTAGCPVCSSAADTFNGAVPHLNARDVTFSCISRAPLENLQAYKRRMGRSFPWASSYGTDSNLDLEISRQVQATREFLAGGVLGSP